MQRPSFISSFAKSSLIAGLPLAFTYSHLIERENATQVIRISTLQFENSTQAIDSLFYEARRLAFVTQSDYRVTKAATLDAYDTTEKKRIGMDAFTAISNYLETSPISSAVETFFICNTHGLYIASEHSRITSSLEDGKLAMERIRRGKVTSVFTITKSLDGERDVIALAVPLLGNDAAIYMELSTSILSSLFTIETDYVQNGLLTKEGEAMFLDHEGPLPDHWTENYNQKDRYHQGQEDYLTARFTSLQCDFSLVSLLDYTKLASLKSNLYYTVFSVSMLLIVVAFLLGSVLSKQINKPVDRLIEHIRRLQHRDFTPDPAIETGVTEFAQIGKTLNEMTREINKLMEETKEMYEEKQKREIALLQSQVNPHFLYNTLESIKWMAHIQKNVGIEKMTKNLVTLLKNLSKGTDDIISLREECTLLDAYIAIQEERYIDSFDFINNLSDELLDGARIRKFTLQPIVENALIHGIGTSETPNGLIIPDGKFTDTQLILEISDNGVGMDEATVASLLTTERKGKMTGMGIYSVNKRIQLNFGPSYGLSIRSAIGKGTTVTICLPRRIDV